MKNFLRRKKYQNSDTTATILVKLRHKSKSWLNFPNMGKIRMVETMLGLN